MEVNRKKIKDHREKIKNENRNADGKRMRVENDRLSCLASREARGKTRLAKGKRLQDKIRKANVVCWVRGSGGRLKRRAKVGKNMRKDTHGVKVKR
jgi:hypothetical protein